MPKYCCIMGVTLAAASGAEFIAVGLDDDGLDGGELVGIVVPRK